MLEEIIYSHGRVCLFKKCLGISGKLLTLFSSVIEATQQQIHEPKNLKQLSCLLRATTFFS
jgi:hypothetical protein